MKKLQMSKYGLQECHKMKYNEMKITFPMKSIKVLMLVAIKQEDLNTKFPTIY